MAIQPTGGGSQFGQPPQRKVSRSVTDQQAREAEKEARNRVNNAQNMVQDAEKEAYQRVEAIKDQYLRMEAVEQARQEGAVNAERQKGYEALREIQRALQAEKNRVRRDGERELTELKNYYRDSTYRTEREGQRDIDELKQRTLSATEQEDLNYKNQTETANSEHNRRISDLVKYQGDNYEQLKKNHEEEYQTLRNNLLAASEKSEEHFGGQFQEAVKKQNKTLDDLNRRVSSQINEIRRDTARQLAAYESRQSDPFYRMVDINASLEETDEAYYVFADIPEHEQNNISVSVKGNQLVLSGNRRSQEKLEERPGQIQSTSSFQSFSQTFPIPWPVESKLLSKEFVGEQLVICVPKKQNSYAPQAYQPKKHVDKARVERPVFPSNIPLHKGDAAAAAIEAEVEQAKTDDEKKAARIVRGTKPLT